MKKKLTIILFVLIIITVRYEVVHSATVTLSTIPNPASELTSFSANVSMTFSSPPGSCDVTVRVTDVCGNLLEKNGVCSGNPSCVLSLPFILHYPGIYTFTALPRPGGACSEPFLPVTSVHTSNCQPPPQFNFSGPEYLPSATSGQFYSSNIAALATGVSPFAFQLVSGSLPPGMNLSHISVPLLCPPVPAEPWAVLSGTPTASGIYHFTIRATDSCPFGQQSSDKLLSITVQCPPISITTNAQLTEGTVGKPYSYQIGASGGEGTKTFDIVSGSLPQGLTLNLSGMLSGMPTTAGTFNFSVRAADSCPLGTQSTQKDFSIIIGEPPASPVPSANINVAPSSFSIARNTASTAALLYTLTSSSPSETVFNSSRGIFLAGGNVIGEVNVPISVTSRHGSGTVAETLNIPVAIGKRAEGLGITQVIYQREFTSHTGPSLTASAVINLTTEGGLTELKIVSIRLYFENDRPEITVKRNQHIKASADIRYSGSGLLQGFWEVDGRRISDVFMHLVYGTDVTLETPSVPPLPTFSPGVHKVKLVVLNPQGVPLPEAIYFVEEKAAEKVLPITLLSPLNFAAVDLGGTSFLWKGPGSMRTYVIDFYERDGVKPIFGAITRETEYRLTPAVVKKGIFAYGKSYIWVVRGFDADEKLLGESAYYTIIISEPKENQKKTEEGK